MNSQKSTVTLPIIATHHSPLKQKFGTPRQPNLVASQSVIVLHPPYNDPKAVAGLSDFSHLWVVWHSHHNKAQKHFRPLVRPPRLGGNDTMGVFATRAVYRPSSLGLSVVNLISIDCQDGVRLHITGADFIDQTPIVDIKPYLPYSDCVMAKSPMPAPKARMVTLTDHAKDKLEKNGYDTHTITQLIAQDPRPAYKQQEIHTHFFMRYGAVDVGFFDDGTALVIDEIKDVLV